MVRGLEAGADDYLDVVSSGRHAAEKVAGFRAPRNGSFDILGSRLVMRVLRGPMLESSGIMNRVVTSVECAVSQGG